MNINNPGAEDYDAKHPPMDATTINVRPPPLKLKRAIRKAGEIEPAPDRTDSVNNGEETNNVTPRTAKSKKSRENKDPKRTKMQQTMKTFMKELKTNKQEKNKHNMVAQVKGKRLKSSKRLVPLGLTAKLRADRAAQSRKEAEDADEDDGPKKLSPLGQATATAKLSHQ